MNPYYALKPGQEVTVHVHGAQTTLTTCGIIRHVPVATGDSWIIEDKETRVVFYISEGCTIVRTEKAATEYHMKENEKKEKEDANS
jgi:hypothetical protein